MTQCYQNSMEFPRVHRRVVEARFDGGEITCDGGALLLRQADRYLGLTQAVAEALSDPRRRKSCAHDVRSLVRQRVYAVALGYEDLNDHDTLRREVGLQTVVERDRPLASASTLCGSRSGPTGRRRGGSTRYCWSSSSLAWRWWRRN